MEKSWSRNFKNFSIMMDWTRTFWTKIWWCIETEIKVLCWSAVIKLHETKKEIARNMIIFQLFPPNDMLKVKVVCCCSSINIPALGNFETDHILISWGFPNCTFSDFILCAHCQNHEIILKIAAEITPSVKRA